MNEQLEYYLEHCRNCGELLGKSSYEIDECYECYTPFSREQRFHSQENPEVYTSMVSLPSGETKMVLEQAEYLDLKGKIEKVFGVFGVTNSAIECLSHDYSIVLTRLESEDWVKSMSSKTWVNIEDFKRALEFGKQLLINT